MACRRGQAGVLPDGRGIFLLSNAAPAHVRDPLTVSLAAQLALRLLPQSLTKGHTDRPLQRRLRLLRVQDRADMHRPRRRGDDMQNAKPPEPQRRPKLSPGSQRRGARAGCDAGPLRCGDEQQGGRGGDEGAVGLAPGRAGMMPVKPSGMCAQMTSCFSSEIEEAAIIAETRCRCRAGARPLRFRHGEPRVDASVPPWRAHESSAAAVGGRAPMAARCVR